MRVSIHFIFEGDQRQNHNLSNKFHLNWRTVCAQAAQPSVINNSPFLDNKCTLTQAITPEKNPFSSNTHVNNLSARLPFKENDNDVCAGLISIIADSSLVAEFSKP